MTSKRHGKDGESSEFSGTESGLNRRALIQAMPGGLALIASGLLPP